MYLSGDSETLKSIWYELIKVGFESIDTCWFLILKRQEAGGTRWAFIQIYNTKKFKTGTDRFDNVLKDRIDTLEFVREPSLTSSSVLIDQLEHQQSGVCRKFSLPELCPQQQLPFRTKSLDQFSEGNKTMLNNLLQYQHLNIFGLAMGSNYYYPATMSVFSSIVSNLPFVQPFTLFQIKMQRSEHEMYSNRLFKFFHYYGQEHTSRVVCRNERFEYLFITMDLRVSVLSRFVFPRCWPGYALRDITYYMESLDFQALEECYSSVKSDEDRRTQLGLLENTRRN
jgi:hypothetical protein